MVICFDVVVTARALGGIMVTLVVGNLPVKQSNWGAWWEWLVWDKTWGKFACKLANQLLLLPCSPTGKGFCWTLEVLGGWRCPKSWFCNSYKWNHCLYKVLHWLSAAFNANNAIDCSQFLAFLAFNAKWGNNVGQYLALNANNAKVPRHHLAIFRIYCQHCQQSQAMFSNKLMLEYSLRGDDSFIADSSSARCFWKLESAMVRQHDG